MCDQMQEALSTDRDRRRLKFRRKGGVRQAVLDKARDLPALLDLDPKDWMALSCPASGHEMDDTTLRAIDTDGDGRIRVREIRETIQWLSEAFKDLSVLEAETDHLLLSDLNTATAAGSDLTDSIRHLLQLTASNEEACTLDLLRTGYDIIEDEPMDGDGILDERATADERVKGLIHNIVSTTGGEPTRQGTTGVTHKSLHAFLEACAAFSEWPDAVEWQAAKSGLPLVINPIQR